MASTSPIGRPYQSRSLSLTTGITQATNKLCIMQAFFSLAFFCCLTNKCCFSTSLSTLGSAPPSTPPEVWIKDNEIPCFSSRFCVSRGFAAHIPPFGSPSVERQGLDKHSPTANAFSLFFLGKQQDLAKRRQNLEQEGRHESWFCNFLTE